MARTAAVVLLLLGLLPVANWIPGGHEAPWYGERLALWLPGAAILAGIAVIAAITLRRHPTLWRTGGWHRLAARWRDGGVRADATVALTALAAYLVVAVRVLSARPLLIDEVIQVWQARLLASGRLFLPAPAYPEFTSAMHLVDLGDKVYGQFPVGGPAMLALGALVRAEWLVGPAFAAAGLFCFSRLLRRVEAGPGTALAALLLAAFAPFVLFLSGSMMNHVTVTAWLLAAALAMAIATEGSAPRPLAALGAGLALGVAATIRPLDAAAFALPAAAWLAWRLRQGRAHLAPLLWSGLGVAVPLAALLWVNATWTGHPLRFGYIELWGVTHELGFHEAPWGFPHTPVRGIELVNLYLLRLQTYFLETPAPALLFATAALALVPRLTAFDRWVLTGSALLLLSYWAYWHDGFYLGPRFLLPLAPWLALWTARLPAVLRARGVAPWLRRGVLVAGVAALAIAAAQLVPIRWRQYQNGMVSMRLDADQLAQDHGVRDGLILVREGWGAQLIARMWGLGVSRPEAERIYRRSDACTLDRLLDRADLEGLDAAGFVASVAPFLADTASLLTVRLSPDTTLKTLPGALFTDKCRRRIAEEMAGTTIYAPLLLAGEHGNLYRRDLHARDTLLPDSLWQRPVWLLTQRPETGGALRLEPVDLDSLRREWSTP